jgi:drug/metabolite transporter (DMT)-like permease
MMYDQPNGMDEFKKVGKKYLYTAAIAVAGSVLLGDTTLSDEGKLFDMNIPLPIFAGLGAGLGSVVSNVASDYVVDKMFDDSTIRTTERTIVGVGLAAVGSVAGLKYLSGLPPSLDRAILGAGSYIGGEYMYFMDSLLLGRLF